MTFRRHFKRKCPRRGVKARRGHCSAREERASSCFKITGGVAPARPELAASPIHRRPNKNNPTRTIFGHQAQFPTFFELVQRPQDTPDRKRGREATKGEYQRTELNLLLYADRNAPKGSHSAVAVGAGGRSGSGGLPNILTRVKSSGKKMGILLMGRVVSVSIPLISEGGRHTRGFPCWFLRRFRLAACTRAVPQLSGVGLNAFHLEAL